MVIQFGAVLPRTAVDPVKPGHKNTETGQTLSSAVELDRDVLNKERREKPKQQPGKKFPLYNQDANPDELCSDIPDIDVTA